MARNSVPSWQEAILSVLEGSKGRPLKNVEIAGRADRLRQSKGGDTVTWPQSSVHRPLQGLLKNKRVKKSGSGYVLSNDTGKRSEDEPKAARAKGTTRITVTSYGLNWTVNDVDWKPANGRLLGAVASDSQPVDFAGQDAVYLLKKGDRIIYVGQTSEDAKSTGLYSRLRQHYRNKMDRWDTFSWFGFRPVKKDGQLSPANGTANTSQVIKLIEAIFIEALPATALNKQRGRDAKNWIQYRQQRDPNLA